MKQTPKEKANELLDNYWLMDKINPSLSKEQAKQCALIVVEQILDVVRIYETYYDNNFKYWINVKQQIEKL